MTPCLRLCKSGFWILICIFLIYPLSFLVFNKRASGQCLYQTDLQNNLCMFVCVQNGHLECVRWMVSETEAIAELSCSREHPSLIHYAARYGQVRETDAHRFITLSLGKYNY